MTDQGKCEHGTASAINHREAVNPAPGQTLKGTASQKCLPCQHIYHSMRECRLLSDAQRPHDKLPSLARTRVMCLHNPKGMLERQPTLALRTKMLPVYDRQALDIVGDRRPLSGRHGPPEHR